MARRLRQIRNRIIASQSLDLSVTSKSGAIAQAKELWSQARDAREFAEYLQAWHDVKLSMKDQPYLPDDIPEELKTLRRNSLTPFARMVINETSQLLAVDDIRLSGADESAPAFRIWQQNGLDSKQVPLHRAALTHGMAYNVVLPAVGRMDGQPTALIRPKSALRMTAFYRDDFDEYPEVALEVVPLQNSDGSKSLIVTLYDDVMIHRMSANMGDGSDLQYIEGEPHNMGVCPVIRFANINLEGESLGEIAPLIPAFRRIDQATCDKLIVQRFGAFVVRTIAGMAEPKTDEQKRAARIALGAGDFMVSEDPKTQFGHIPGTPLDGYIRSREGDVSDMAAAAQVPAWRFLGLGDNIGADAIKASTESQQLHGNELKRVYGESHEATLRLAGHAIGDRTIAEDFTSHVHWVPRNVESLLTLTQGLGTMVRDLKIDPKLVWEYLPDWDRDKTEKAQDLREKEEARAMLMAAMGATAEGEPGGNSADRAADQSA